MDLNVNITVSLSGATLDVLRQFTPDMPEKVCDPFASHQDLKTEVEGIVVDFLSRFKKHAENPVEEPKAEPAQEPVREEKAPQAAPETTAQAETEEITDAELREAVKAAKNRTSAKAVKAVFAEFGIENSSACPAERRSELKARLENL
jgi:hypothetical protein